MALRRPRRGEKKGLVDMVAENARQGLEQYRIKQLAAPDALGTALAELKEALHLPRIPLRIECYDISNIQGAWAVGSMVVFEGGVARPPHYRRFRIRTVAGADDCAMLQEVLKRRFKRAASGDSGNGWAIMPDLVLIDGGKGQVAMARDVFQALGLPLSIIVGVEKGEGRKVGLEELVFADGRPKLQLAPSSAALMLVAQIRDEAHRFAITGMRARRASVRTGGSKLEDIAGVGPRKRARLLQRFGGLRGVASAGVDDLASVEGISRDLAEEIYRALH